MGERRTGGVALVAHPGAELYGSDRMTLEAVAGLVEHGWRVVVAVPGDGPLVAAVRGLGAETVLVRTLVLRKRLLRPAGLLRLLPVSLAAGARVSRTLRRVRPDVVYVATVTIPLWIVVARLLRVPVVTHVHESERSAPAMVRRALTAPVVLSSRVLVNSEHSRSVLLEVAPRLWARSVVLYNGVAGPASTTTARARIDGAFRLVYTGRISPRKGVDVAIEALGLLVSEGLDVRLDLVGSVFEGYEWYLRALEQRIDALGLRDRVEFTGFRPEVWSALAQADMALVPSREEEPFGNTAVEAVLAGRPVAVSAIGGLEEAIDGFTSAVPVPPADPAALADAIRRVMRSWGAFRRTAIAMAPIAAARYSPGRFRDAIDAELRRAVEPVRLRVAVTS